MDSSKQKVLIAGSSGLIGTALSTHLTIAGYDVWQLKRGTGKPQPGVLYWQPDIAVPDDLTAFEGFTTIVNLCGANIGEGRWTEKRKAILRSSRLEPTRKLAEIIAKLERPPQVWLNASAIGFYGDKGSDWLDETSATGNGFLAALCNDWEAAVSFHRDGVRVITFRLGVVFDEKQGALPRMMLPIKLGVGGWLGNGKQFVSWISLQDVVHAVEFMMKQSSLVGAVNLVSPDPITNRDLTKLLARKLHRPAFLSVPEFALRLLLGEMADSLLLHSARVRPNRLLDAGFQFKDTTVESYLSRI